MRNNRLRKRHFNDLTLLIMLEENRRSDRCDDDEVSATSGLGGNRSGGFR